MNWTRLCVLAPIWFQWGTFLKHTFCVPAILKQSWSSLLLKIPFARIHLDRIRQQSQECLKDPHSLFVWKCYTSESVQASPLESSRLGGDKAVWNQSFFEGRSLLAFCLFKVDDDVCCLRRIWPKKLIFTISKDSLRLILKHLSLSFSVAPLKLFLMQIYLAKLRKWISA